MTNPLSRSPVPLRDVLYELALVQDIPNAELLDDFVRRYPEHAVALTDFAVELVVESFGANEQVEATIDTARVSPAVSRAMSKFQNALHANRVAKATATAKDTAPAASTDNLFANLDRAAFRQLARDLNANVVFVCKLRDRQIEPKTISVGFLQVVANALQCSLDAIAAFLAGESATNLRPQFYKADGKPETGLQQSFEDAVRSSGLTEEQQRYLLSL